MSSPEFPTYGRGEESKPAEDQHYAQPQPYGSQPGQYGGPPPPPQQYGEYAQPPAYRPGHPYGAPAAPESHELPTYGRPESKAARDPRAERVLLIAAIVAGFYGLLVITMQRVSIREITQAPGSPLNHPLRTDVIDTLGQLLTILVGAVALYLWARDLLARRKVKEQPETTELVGLVLIAVSVIPLLLWLGLVLSTGLGANDGTLDRLPRAYGFGGLGLLVLAAGFALGYRTFKPAFQPVVRSAPGRAPWE
ncbi:hypothetical protein HPO96_17195 [Kribbella sandramycini]|uniref:Uncharacterized protein n=1 Tax=Kribbella sandramycini TaxID=60450 RepID=A0A7Y4L0E7_9ACTN|nr:hypothetical protein [Kribbella sandramycini]MBB6565722.1 hypothetical protein [Kribbella sandramycini]NOL41984.1 hypothetical protein [Kribbella sandramycini]